MTLIREYIQSTNAMGYSLPTGSFDRNKHTTLIDTAAAELAEEAELEGGTMLCLMGDENHAGFVESKWCANRFKPYLCIDPVTSVAPPERDVEEFSIQVERVSVEKFKRLMYGGDMMLPSIIGAQMALDYLEKKGMLGQGGGGGGGGGCGGGVVDDSSDGGMGLAGGSSSDSGKSTDTDAEEE